MHSINNLFKINDLVKEVNFESLSLAELKVHYTRIKSIEQKTKLLNSLPDKGEKYKKKLKYLEDLIRLRCTDVEKQYQPAPETSIKNESDLAELLEKFHMIQMDKSEKTTLNKEDREENMLKSAGPAHLPVKIETTSNYFARTEKINTKEINKSKNYHEIKEKILQNMKTQSKYPTAKYIPINECCQLIKEHEKRVHQYQILQTANKLLQGSTTVYDYNVSNKTTSSKFRERKDCDNFDSDSDGSEDDENDNDKIKTYDYAQDDETNSHVNKIDRLHLNQMEKYKFKLNEDLDN